MYINELKQTLRSFIKPHRDRLIPSDKRFSTMITGGSGIGKTQNVLEVASELDMICIIVHVAQLEPADLVGIPVPYEIRPGVTVQRYVLPGYLPHPLVNEKGENVVKRFDDGIERELIDCDSLGSKIRNRVLLEQKHGKEWSKQVKGAVLFLDEINRAKGDDTKEAIFELPGDYALHEYEVPSSCVIIAAQNPPTSEYNVNDMDQEKAWMDRFIHLTAEARYDDALSYFQDREAHPSILSFIKADQKALFVPEESYELPITRTPRSWERVNTLLQFVELPKEDAIKREVFIGILGKEYGHSFTNHLSKSLTTVPSAKEILTNYESHRPFVNETTSDRRNDILNLMGDALIEQLTSAEETNSIFYRYAEEEDVDETGERPVFIGDPLLREDRLHNLYAFLIDLPKAIRMSKFQQLIRLPHVYTLLNEKDDLFLKLLEDNGGHSYER
ncbi:hypothetical protein IMZ31_20615 (plasmid) [Pontibacillus sp. ALD_SL1]|uniref:hypothetical protein n=1 Tax=Pontibacillus sp. ALD_SL1 TaxID=2777185 RepID=UPI001A9792FD|nr:hypothetical protein [Pontibacillus sp. ALD_SL1]QST02953.1 hypothetical protein IMZ31_20615 [Pontibacillus sp. ALD_SL1]